MSALGLIANPIGMRVAGVGFVLMAVALVLAILRHRRQIQTIERIVQLAVGGHSQEARVLARASGGWARPLVAALGGERPESGSFAVGLDTVCAGIALLGIAHGAVTALLMRLMPAPPSMAADIGALLASMVVITPLVLIAVSTIVRLGSAGRRRVRTAGVEILVKQLAAPAAALSTKPRPKDSR